MVASLGSFFLLLSFPTLSLSIFCLYFFSFSLACSPHCNRRFHPDTAEEHIPKCRNVVNKPTQLRRVGVFFPCFYFPPFAPRNPSRAYPSTLERTESSTGHTSGKPGGTGREMARSVVARSPQALPSSTCTASTRR